MRRALFRLSLVSALIVSFARSSPAAGPVGTPAFRLATCATCTESNPQIAGAPSGKLVTAFDLKPFSAQLTPYVQGRLFPGPGAGRTPFRPQTNPLPAQYDAAVAANAAGAFVIAWSTTDPLTRNSDIWAQRYDAANLKKGATIPVNLDVPGVRVLDTVPTVAMGSDGGFTVAWLRIVPPGEANPTGYQVWARRYAATGVPLGPPVQVSTGLVEGNRPSACIDTAGRSVIAWSTDADTDPFLPIKKGVSMRRMTPKGVPMASVAVVALPKSSETHPAVSCGLAGTFVVAWETDQPPATGVLNVVAQRYSTAAARVGTVFVASAKDESQRTPAIAHDAGGNFVIVWQEVFSPTTGIYGQRFSATATKLGDPFTVALAESSIAPLTAPDVTAAGAANAFAVAWKNPKVGLLGRRFKIVP